MSEVGALIVRLQAETAQFREDMGKVKKDLDDLKGGADSAGEGIDYSMAKARGSLMLVEDAVGIRLPRALNNLISTMPMVGAAFEAMLPFAGVLVAIGVIGKLIAAHAELKEKIRESGQEFAKAGNEGSQAMLALEDKLLQSGIKVDELTKNHLDALHKQLQLIDNQSLNELIETFGKFSGFADAVFAQLKTSWYEFGSGSAGAKNALTDFTNQYDKLLLSGDKAGASNLLAGTLKDAKEAQAALKAVQEGQPTDPKAKFGSAVPQQQEAAWQEKLNLLRKDGLLPTVMTEEALRKEVMAQDELVDVLTRQGQAQQLISQTAANDKQAAKLTEAKRSTEEGNKAMEAQLALQRILLAGTDAHIAAMHKLAQTNAEAALAAQKTPEQSSSDDSAHKLAAIEIERNAAVQAANDELNAKNGAYNAEAKAAQSNKAKLRELDAQYANDVRANADAIAQINAEANAKGVAVPTEAKNEEARAAIAATQERYDGELKAAITGAQNQAKLAIETAKNLQALGRLTSMQVLQVEIQANAVLAAQEKSSYDKRISLLDQFSKDYAKTVAKLNSEVLADTTKGDMQVEQEKRAALQRQTQDTVSAQNRMTSAIATDIAHSIVMNKSLAQAFRQTGEQMAEGMIKNLLIAEMTGNKQKLIDAKTAAANSYQWASAWGGPVAGAIAGAAAFSGVMAFANGGLVPGSGSGDTVPAMLTPGETVVTKALTSRVESAERNRGSGGGGGDTHIHFAPQIHAVDAEGVDRVLTKHSSIFQRHVSGMVRKANK